MAIHTNISLKTSGRVVISNENGPWTDKFSLRSLAQL